jgi:hypothetical protein
MNQEQVQDAKKPNVNIPLPDPVNQSQFIAVGLQLSRYACRNQTTDQNILRFSNHLWYEASTSSPVRFKNTAAGNDRGKGRCRVGEEARLLVRKVVACELTVKVSPIFHDTKTERQGPLGNLEHRWEGNIEAIISGKILSLTFL